MLGIYINTFCKLDAFANIFSIIRFRRVVGDARQQVPKGESYGYDALFRLKREVAYEFFHGSRFPGQGGEDDKCFIFKMSTMGPGSGLDLVNRMRRTGDGDLRSSWVQFDHTHRAKGWVTMACHVYDPRYTTI